MKILITILIAAALINSCKKKVEQNLSSTPKLEFINKDSIPHSPINTTESRHLDTIVKVGQSDFRIFQDTANNELRFRILKKKINNWQSNIEQQWTSLYQYKDWNKDGYMDIILEYHHGNEIIVFNPNKNLFVDYGNIGGQIKDVQNIGGNTLQCNFDEFRTNWQSELMGIDSNYNKISYGFMQSEEENENKISFINVYKRHVVHNAKYGHDDIEASVNHQKTLIEKINLHEQIFFKGNADIYDSLRSEFIKNYWSKNWRKIVDN